jgi:acetyl-CoA acetyltransferase
VRNWSGFTPRRKTGAAVIKNRPGNKGVRFGLQTVCEGGGQANATILELMR